MIVIKEKTYDEQQYISLMNSVYRTRRKISIVAGVGLVLAGVVTLPVPTGSIQMIGFGMMLIFVPGTSFRKICKKIKWNIITKIKMRKNK